MCDCLDIGIFSHNSSNSPAKRNRSPDGKTQKERIKEITKQLEAGVTAVFESDAYKASSERNDMRNKARRLLPANETGAAREKAMELTSEIKAVRRELKGMQTDRGTLGACQRQGLF